MPQGYIAISKYMYDHFPQEIIDIYNTFIQQGKDVKHSEKKKGRDIVLYTFLNHPDFLPDEPERVYTLYIARKRDQWGNYVPYLASLRTLKGVRDYIVKEYV